MTPHLYTLAKITKLFFLTVHESNNLHVPYCSTFDVGTEKFADVYGILLDVFGMELQKVL